MLAVGIWGRNLGDARFGRFRSLSRWLWRLEASPGFPVFSCRMSSWVSGFPSSPSGWSSCLPFGPLTRSSHPDRRVRGLPWLAHGGSCSRSRSGFVCRRLCSCDGFDPRCRNRDWAHHREFARGQSGTRPWKSHCGCGRILPDHLMQRPAPTTPWLLAVLVLGGIALLILQSALQPDTALSRFQWGLLQVIYTHEEFLAAARSGSGAG